MKRVFLITVLIVLTLLLISCGVAEETTSGESEPTVTTENRYLDLSEFTVIYPESRPGKLRVAIEELIFYFEKKGVSPICKKDIEIAPNDREIIIGDTNRHETESAKVLCGNKDYVIGVIGEKPVIYAKDAASYPFAVKKFLSLLKEDSLMLEKTQLKAYDVIYREMTDITVGRDQTLSISVKLLSSESTAKLYFLTDADESAGGYVLKIDNSSITFYRKDAEQTVMASKNAQVKPNRAYTVRFVFDSNYCTVYFHDDMEGVEPWPEFDLKVDLSKELHVMLGEESGYGAEFYDCQVTPTEDKTLSEKNYQNPLILDHADPDILYHDGVYYLFATSKGYDCYTSTDLVNWSYRGKAMPHGGWGIDNQYWAPDVEEINGKFYMAVSFGEEGFGIAVSDRPEGPYECQGSAPLLKTTIDGHIFVDDDGKVYLYYTSWYDGRSYGIYGVEMSDDLITPKWETETKILTPTKEWEKHEGDVIEAPYMLKHNGLYYMIYSASHTKSKYYAVGYAVSHSPLAGFKKSNDSPILSLTSDVHGTGHCSVITAPDNKTMLIVYHCHNSTETPYPRHTCIDKIRFAPTESGNDCLEVWGPTSRSNEVTWIP